MPECVHWRGNAGCRQVYNTGYWLGRNLAALFVRFMGGHGPGVLVAVAQQQKRLEEAVVQVSGKTGQLFRLLSCMARLDVTWRMNIASAILPFACKSGHDPLPSLRCTLQAWCVPAAVIQPRTRGGQ